MLKKIGTACLAVVAVLTIGACSTRSPVDYVLLRYGGGAEDRSFEHCIQPGQSGDDVVDDYLYALPTSLRTWKVEPGSTDFDGVFNVGSAPDKNGQAGPQMAVRSTVEFYLNTYCGKPSEDGKTANDASSPVVQFWEKTGRRYEVSTDGEDGSNFNVDNWKNVLKDTVHTVEEGLLQAESRKYDDDALDTNKDGIWEQMEKSLADKFNAQLRAKVGGDYFCGVTFDRSKPECPAVFIDILGIDYADKRIQDARVAVRVAEEDAKAEFLRAKAELEKANLLAQANRNPGYLEYAKLEAAKEIARLNYEAAKACSANPNCTVIVGVDEVGVHAGK
jgi:hypothetical protein